MHKLERMVITLTKVGKIGVQNITKIGVKRTAFRVKNYVGLPPKIGNLAICDFVIENSANRKLNL